MVPSQPMCRLSRPSSVDLIRLEEGLAQELVTPCHTPIDVSRRIGTLLGGLKRLSTKALQDDGPKSVPKARQRRNTGGSSGRRPVDIAIGMRCEVISPVTVRSGESLETSVVQELPAGTELEVLVLGVDRRMMMRTLSGDSVVGWVSARTQGGMPLLGISASNWAGFQEPDTRAFQYTDFGSPSHKKGRQRAL